MGSSSASATSLRWTGSALLASVWASAALFGAYILVHFAGALLDGQTDRWNETLPDLFNPDNPIATLGIGAHFAAGGIILSLGPIQLIAGIRDRWPTLHRWTGRLYVLTCLMAGVGGLTFIALQGTLGGATMDIGFGLYGLLMIWASVEAYRNGRARRLDVHRAWGIRLFALAIGSWLYRMEYGFWFLTFGGLGHTDTFDGPFDWVMAFFFYLPNLLVAEAYLRAEGAPPPALRWGLSAAFVGAVAFIVLATWKMTTLLWAPAILAAF